MSVDLYVDLYESGETLGGSYGGYFEANFQHGSHPHTDQTDPSDTTETTFHAHAYRMLPAWYENFYQCAEDINAGLPIQAGADTERTAGSACRGGH